MSDLRWEPEVQAFWVFQDRNVVPLSPYEAGAAQAEAERIRRETRWVDSPDLGGFPLVPKTKKTRRIV